MGRWIDGAALTVLSAALFFALYAGAFGSIPLAMALAFASCVLARRVVFELRKRLPRTPWARRRALRTRAAACLDAWSRLPDEELRRRMEEALAALYPDAGECELAVLPRTVAGPPLGCGECFALWRAHRGKDHLLIACTGDAAAEAQTFVRALDGPQVRLLDRRQLAAGLVRAPGLLPPETDASRQQRRLCLPGISRARAVHCLWTGLGLLLGYALLGRAFYLAAGLAMLLLAGLALKRDRLPEKLFRDAAE